MARDGENVKTVELGEQAEAVVKTGQAETACKASQAARPERTAQPDKSEKAKKAKKAKRLKKWTLARRIVQVCMLVLFCLPLFFAGWGLLGGFVGDEYEVRTPSAAFFYGSLGASELGAVNIIDPFAALQALAAARALDLGILLGLAPALVVYAIIRGRAFCGWVCPVNFLLEGVDWVRAKLGITVCERTIPRHAKMGLSLAILVISAVVALPVFELFSPIAAINRGILFGSLASILTLVAIVIAELFWSRRVWCRSLCPVGGLYEAIGRVGLLNVKADMDACIHCGACERVCLADPEILKPVLAGSERAVRAGDCMACGACVDACPTHALSMGLGWGGPKEVIVEAQSAGSAKAAGAANAAGAACAGGAAAGGANDVTGSTAAVAATPNRRSATSMAITQAGANALAQECEEKGKEEA